MPPEPNDEAPASGQRGGRRERKRSRRWRSPEEPCLNCGDAAYGRYCPSCGQRKLDVQVSVRTMLRDVLEDQLALSGALPRTLVGLLFRPGHLTNEYIRGRIVSYIAPFRLYLVASVVFFLLFSFIGLAALESAEINIQELERVVDARSALAEFDENLANADTSALPPAARTALRSSRATLEAALTRALADSAAAARAIARMQGEPPVAPVAPPAVPGTGAGQRPADPVDAEAAAGGAAPQPFPPAEDGLQPWARQIRVDSPLPFFDRAVQRKIRQVGHLTPREALGQVLRDYVEFAPHMVFLLLPVFALLLQVLYIRRKRFYAEHFVFALHTHAFAFLTFTLMLLLPWKWLDGILLTWMIAYLWIAMRTVYRQGAVRTTVKWWLLGWSYLWVFAFGMVGLAIVTLLMT